MVVVVVCRSELEDMLECLHTSSNTIFCDNVQCGKKCNLLI